MDAIAGLSLGFSNALSLANLGWALLGCFLGTAVGVLPGIGPNEMYSVVDMTESAPTVFHPSYSRTRNVRSSWISRTCVPAIVRSTVDPYFTK